MTDAMPHPIERRALSDDLTIARLLTGLWQIADMERDGRSLDLDATAAAMVPYVAAGCTTFDMADHYGSAELVAGRFRRAYEDKHAGKHAGKHAVAHTDAPVQLLTKWVPKPGPISRADVEAAVTRAVDRLGGRPIDLLQFHAWTFADAHWLDALFALQELRDAGYIRAIGLTNFDAAHWRIALTSGIRPVTNQVSCSLLDQRAAGALSALCAEFDVQLLAYGTVAGGLLTERWLGQAEPASFATWSQMKYGRFVAAAGGWDALQRVLRTTQRIAQKHSVSMANVACRAILDVPGVAGIIVGARLGERAHIEDNAQLFSFAFDAEDRTALAEVIATLTPIAGDCGDEYRRPPYLTASGDLSHHLDAIPAPYEVRQVVPGRSLCLSGTIWEPLAGFSRATRVGNRIHVSGTTATHGHRAIGGPDPAAQAHFVIDKLEGAVVSLGGRLEDVVRTRIFVRHASDWEAVARAHGERFGHIQPANTLVQAALIGDEYLVEMEAEAEVPG